MKHLEGWSATSARESRREFLRTAAATLAGAVLSVDRSSALGQTTGAGKIDPSFPAEDVRRYGVIPDSEVAAAANTTALQRLVNPAGTFTGNLSFPNVSGRSVYYFNDLIPFHDGIHLDLQNSTLSFTKSGDRRDSTSGFIHALRDFSIENGTIVTSYEFKGGTNTGSSLAFGGRGTDSTLFPKLYDRLLSSPMGKIVVRNLRVVGRSSGPNARGILMLGGLDGVLIDNVTIDGQNQLLNGIYYEFGWATNEVREQERQSSHARNIHLTNLTVVNVTNEAFGAMGAYDILIDGMRVKNAGSVCIVGTGEALYFRPWVPSGDLTRRPSIAMRNVVGEVKTIGVLVTGASKISGSYLDNAPAHDNPYHLGAAQQTDLIDFSLEGFDLAGSLRNFGISTSAATAQISNGTLTNFVRGIVTTQECTKFTIDSVKVFDSGSFGIQIGQTVAINAPPRLSSGVIRNCVVAGSGTQGWSAGILVSTTRECLIEGCRFGYAASTDGKDEKTQTQAVSVTADASGVTCKNNFVAATNNAVAYLLAGPPGRNCHIDSPRGIRDASGPWH